MELGSVANALGAKVRGPVVRGRLDGAAAVGVAVGMGGGAARAVATERPRLVVSCGFAGALDPALDSGDLVLASSIRDETGQSIRAPAALLASARKVLEADGDVKVAEGEILCATRVAAKARTSARWCAPVVCPSISKAGPPRAPPPKPASLAGGPLDRRSA